MARGTFAQELGKPRFVLDLLVENPQGQVISAVILAGCVVADRRVSANRAALRRHQHLQHGVDVLGVLGEVGRRTRGDVVKRVHTV